ncbi:FG-GAP repeat domain-containing protein [Streptomyces sp. NPDC013171]|uniref:FG-GAP repeat domain-containing protein n=1 Tax=Streptomyces sp. NPDC013171 TaxID=3364863 RepID=UPI0036C13488
MHTRTSPRRLAAAVTAVLAVTAGAALTVTTPAAAAPAAVQAPAQAADTVGVIADDAHVVSAGSTGYLTRRTSSNYVNTYYWTSFADGTTKALDPAYVYDGGRSDFVVAHKPTETRYRLLDMAHPDAAPIGLTYGDGNYTLAGVAGETLVMTYYDRNRVNALDAFLMTRPDGWSTSPVTRDLALPVAAHNLRVAATTPDTALIQYQTGLNEETEYFLATVELATGTITQTVSVGTKPPRNGIYLTATQVAWVSKPTDTTAELVTVPRGEEGQRTTVPLGDTYPGTQLDAAIVGGWAVTAEKGGGTATYASSQFPLVARSLGNPSTTVKLLDHVDSMTSAPDGSQLVRGGSVTGGGEGVYRIATGAGGTPQATLVSTAGKKTELAFASTPSVPATVDLDASGGNAAFSWALNRSNAQGTVTLRHTATGRLAQTTWSGYDGAVRDTGVVTFNWSGLLAPSIGGMGGFAPSGDYTWEFKAKPLNGIGPDLVKTGTFKVLRKAGLHDYTNNGSADLLARDASGRLFRDDTVKVTSSQEVYSNERVQIGTGWQIYNQLEAVGDIAGAPAADLVARDASGVLWQYLGKGDGTFAARTKIGSGWNAYNKITGGSDLNGDGRSDLLATDTSGVLWLYKGTGNWAAPYAARVRVGGGWGAYNQITAVGDIAGSAAGDLVARDTAGVLWLYQGTGAGTFAARTRIGSGWGPYTSLVGAGDFDRDGRNDLYATGPSGSRLYAGTGNTTTPFKPAAFTGVHSDAARFNAIF